jgi:hypothetical protein
MAVDIKFLLSAKDDASQVFGKVADSAKKVESGVSGAFGGLAGSFGKIGGAIGAIVAGAGFKTLVDSTINWNLEAIKLSKTLGITTESASVLNLALGDVYVSQDTMIAGAQRIAKTLSTNEEAFAKLGVATRDANGHFKSTTEIMTDVNTKLNNIKAGTDRNVAGLSIYGKGWQELSGLLKLNNEAMKDAEEKAKRLHLIVGPDGVEKTKKYRAALNDIEDIGKSLAVQFGSVLLPVLVKVGTWFGESGPALAGIFDKVLKGMMKTFETLGSWIGLMAYRFVSLGSVIKNVFTGNFAQAKQDWQNMVAAGEDYSKKVKSLWTNWGDEKTPASKAPTGETFGGNENADAGKELENKLAAQVRAWQEAAKKIIDIERDKWGSVLDAQKTALDKLEKEYDARVAKLDKFKDTLAGIKKSWQPAPGNDLSGLLQRERELDDTTFDPSEKIQGYNELIRLHRDLNQEIIDGTDIIVSKAQADRDAQIAVDRLAEKIQGVEAAMANEESAVVSLAEKIIAQNEAIAESNRQLERLKTMLDSLHDKDINVNIKINGIADLEKALNFTGQSPTVTPTDIPQYATGTQYVPRTGLAIVHQGERIVPASQNSTTYNGGNNITVQVVTQSKDPDGIAREIAPALSKYLGRKL